MSYWRVWLRSSEGKRWIDANKPRYRCIADYVLAIELELFSLDIPVLYEKQTKLLELIR